LAQKKGESWACGWGEWGRPSAAGPPAEGDEKGREERAFGPKAVEGEFLFFFCFLFLFFSFIPKPFQIHFKIYLKYFDFAQNHTLNKTYAPI
jgi:hypothetical protein